MTKYEEKLVDLINGLNGLILEDVRDTDEALYFKIKAIRLLLKADKYQSQALLHYIKAYMSE